MEILNLHQNTQQVVHLFRNLNKEEQYNFFNQVEEEFGYYYNFDFKANMRDRREVKTTPFTKAQFIQDIREAENQIKEGNFQTIEEFEKEAALWK